MCDPESRHKCNKIWDAMMYSLCRTKRVRHVMSQPEDSTNTRSCFPCELARLGVANGSYLAVGVFLVVGYVAGDVAGPAVVLSLLVAAFVGLLTGLCYAEYISHHPARKTSVTSPQYFYILSGEFTATIVGWIQLCYHTASGAVFARAISSTFDFLVNGTITNITNTYTERDSEVPSPDFLAGGIVALVIFVIIFGGKQLECLTVSFSILSLIVLIPLTILSGIHGSPDNWTGGEGFFPFHHTGVFTGSAIFVILFGGYDVIATASKDKSKSARIVGFAILSSNIVNLLALLVLAIFMTLLVPYAKLVKGRPLPTVFYQYGGQWGKYTVGIIAMLCLGSAVMNSISCLVYTAYLMGADGLIPRGCGAINKRTSTPITAAVVTGTFCVIKAIILDYGLLLEVVAIAVLAQQTITCAATMATRYRPLEEDIVNNDSDAIAMQTEPNSASLQKQKVQRQSKKKTSKRALPLSAKVKESEVFHDDSDTNSSEGENEDGDETDIDALVEQYKEKMRAAKVTHIEGPNKNPPKPKPTVFTSTLAAVSTILIVIWCIAIGAILNSLLPFVLDGNPWVISSVILFLILLVITTIILVLQPRREVAPAFRIPLFPVIPVFGIAINVFLVFAVSGYSWLVFGIWIFQGICVYLCYGICHSVESRRYSCEVPEEELVLLQPLPEQPLNEQLVNGQVRREQNIGYQRYHETK